MDLSASNGHLACVRYLVEQGADVNDKNKDGDTALILSASNGHVACVRYLGPKVNDINAKNTDNNTALIFSAEGGHLLCVKSLVELKADVAMSGEQGKTALEWAQIKEKKDVANYLATLAKKAQPDQATIAKWFEAASNKEEGLSTLQKQYNGYNILNVAIKQSSLDQGKTALLLSIEAGCFKNVKFLVEQGAHLHAKGRDGDTALLHSLSVINTEDTGEHIEIMQYLVNQGADIHYKRENGGTALIRSVNRILAKNKNVRLALKVATYLVEQGADINARDAHGNTALILSVGCLKMIEYLVGQGAMINIQNKQESTALHFNAHKGYLGCVRYLCENGANIKLENVDKKTALAYAKDKQESLEEKVNATVSSSGNDSTSKLDREENDQDSGLEVGNIAEVIKYLSTFEEPQVSMPKDKDDNKEEENESSTSDSDSSE